ncbi:type I-E CRISPR-associated protein Cas6/Cse3/CasE [Kitasatospora sp. NPDC093679]|uniref:type I-E CRISPR-associated protein Cas6/Cse3/CasE n=1 Tax=Kitasatospora sp. NPDC093679 TaxID=3154983 RepID=UPI00341819DF
MTTLWLSRIIPDQQHRAARRDGTSAVALHHRIMSLFPDGVPSAEPRRHLGVLFRTETGPHGNQILIQSSQEPDLTRLPDQYGQAQTRTLTPFLDAFRPGLPVRYRIAANAIRKPGRTTREMHRLSSVVPLSGLAADEWWTRQAEAAGLTLTTLHSTPLDAAHGTRRDDRQQVKHARTLFEGTALIADPDRLRTRLAEGIGKGKAYGCGLLSLAPHKASA